MGETSAKADINIKESFEALLQKDDSFQHVEANLYIRAKQ